MSVELKWKHQQETYKAMEKQLKKTHKAAFIYPTSGGKTFPPLKYMEENQDKRILVLAPTREILEQYKEYIQKYIMQSTEPVKSKFRNWHFITYQGLNRFNIKNAKTDIVIADELHRVGGEEWGKAFDTLLENNPEADKIAMTATPKRTDGRNMVDQYFKEDVVYELTKIDALSGDKTGEVVLKPSRYVRVISEMKPVLDHYRKKLESLPDGNEKNTLLKRFEKLEQTIKVADSLEDTFAKSMKIKSGKYIVFCKDEADMKKSMEKAKEWFAKVNPEMHIDYVFSGSKNSEMRKTEKQNRQTMNEFKKPLRENQNKLKLLFCVDKLNEGVHVDGISGIIMLRPTDASVLYEQLIGRAFITADKEQEETAIIDVANNWLRFYDRYKEYVECIQRGKNRREVSRTKKEKNSYESYEFTGEELELLDLLREIDKVKDRSSVSETLRVAQILKDNGVDLGDIQLTKQLDGKIYSTLLSEIEQEGINIDRIIEENGLSRDFKIGKKISNLRAAYNGGGTTKITEEQKSKAEELGLVEEKETVVAKTLRVAQILKDSGVDLGDIHLTKKIDGKNHCILLSEIEQEGINIGEIIEKNGLDENFKYGIRVLNLRALYKGKKEGKITEKEKQQAKDLGLIERKSSVSETLRVAEILKNNGVDLEKIQLSKRVKGGMHNFSLSEIQQEGVDFTKIIKENNLSEDFPYGSKVKQLIEAYNGTRKDILITEEEKRKTEELGLVREDKNQELETLRISKILKNNGIDLEKIQLGKRISKTKRHFNLLSEVQQDGIDVSKIIEENNLDEKFAYGYKINQLRLKYNKGILSEEIRKEMEELGLVDPEKDERHPYIKLLEEIRNWKQENQTEQLPKQKVKPKNEKEEYEFRLASRIGNLKAYIKNKKDNDLSEEEKKIFKEAEELGITDEVKHPYILFLEKIQQWQKENETQEFPKARAQERKLPAEKRTPEYVLGKKLENLKNVFLKKYKNITDEEFLELPEDIQEIITMCAQMGIGNQKNEMVQRMRGYITENIESNSEVRTELLQRVKEFKGKMEKGENKE